MTTIDALDVWLQGNGTSFDISNDNPDLEAYWVYPNGRAHRWYLTEDKTNLDENGIPVDAIILEFNRPLPDKTRLTDVVNLKLMTSLQDAMFYIKESGQTRDMDLQHFSKHFYYLCSIVDYLILNKRTLSPEIYGMANLTTDDLNRIYTDFARDGVCGVAKVQERIKGFFEGLLSDEHSMEAAEKTALQNSHILGRGNVKDLIPKTFTDEQLLRIKGWLFANNAYKTTSEKVFKLTKRSSGEIKQDFIFDVIGRPASGSYLSAKCKMYIRQFEFVADYLSLEFSTQRSCEYLSVNHLTVEELSDKKYSNRSLKAFHHSIINLAKVAHLSPLFPKAAVIGNVDYEFISQEYTSGIDGRTPTIPVDIAMHYLNEALRWVENYGKDIANSYLRYIENYKRTYESSDRIVGSDIHSQVFSSNLIPNSLVDLNIVQFQSIYTAMKLSERNHHGGSMFPSIARKRLSLEDAVDLYIAAIIIIILTTSARRAEEILDLDIGCLHNDGEGYTIGFNLGKANRHGEHVYIKRPIPNVAAKALQRLIDFTTSLKIFYEESNSNTVPHLLYLPFNVKGCKIISYREMMLKLDKFADYIEVPLNSNFRRWYLDPHQCRRFFAISFFWQHKHASYPALAWFLGHIHPDHTVRYVRESISGKELTEEEVRITKDAILSGKRDDDGVNKLRKWAMEYFNTKDVRMIKDYLLEIYLENLQVEGKFHIESFCIETIDAVKYKLLWKVSEEV